MIILLALISSIYLIFGGQRNYQPSSDDPELIYREACLECHGSGRQPANFWTPALTEKTITSTEVKEIVARGTWRMPAFPAITGQVLDSLARYVKEKQFLDQ